MNEPGLIAEEVFEVLPELVTVDEEGNPSGVKYSKLSIYLLEGFKYLFEEIEKLKK